MRRYASQCADSDIEFRKGRRELARHRPDQAVRSLRAAVDECPAARAGELSRNLYWLALALLRLDRPELAIKSLASAKRLRPRSVAHSAYSSRVNDYGMCRRSRPELDDFYAFYSVKACAYLGNKRQGRFDSNAEKDLVTRLIGDAWKGISRSGQLAGRSFSEKMALFRKWPIAFPNFGMAASQRRGKILRPDFGPELKAKDCGCSATPEERPRE